MWELAWADMMADEDRWMLTPKGERLLADGWEPFAVTTLSVYHPEEPGPQDIFRERVWFRRLTA